MKTLKDLGVLPEKKHKFHKGGGCSCLDCAKQSNHNQALSEIGSIPLSKILEAAKGMIEIDEDKIWVALAKAHGCKPDKEDCCFERCNSWGECKELATQISKVGVRCKGET